MVNKSGRGSHGPFNNSANDLGGTESAGDGREAHGSRAGQCRIAANLRLAVTQLQAGEILAKPSSNQSWVAG
jgi:hypothetical protein